MESVYLPRLISVIAALAILVPAASGQRDLTPQAGPLAEADQRYGDLQTVFRQIFEPGVLCRAFLLGNDREECIGLRETPHGFEVLRLTPKTPVSNFARVRDYESGQLQSRDESGPIPLERNERYLELKKALPASPKDIVVTVRSRSIDARSAQRIQAVWKRMLLRTRHGNDGRTVVPASVYHFSMWVRWRGNIGGEVWSPKAESPTGALVLLAQAMSKYAQGDSPADEFLRELRRTERATK